MLSFLKIVQFLKVVGSGESSSSKESKETIPTYGRLSEPSTGSSSTLLKELPINAGTNDVLHHVRLAVRRKYGSPGGTVKPQDVNCERVLVFLKCLRSISTSNTQTPIEHDPTECIGFQGEENSSVTHPDIDVLLKYRAEMIDAIDVCLQEIPVDLHAPRHHQRGGSTVRNTPTPAAPPVQPDSEVESHCFYLSDWHQLLLEVVEVLIAIDATLYFEYFKRGKRHMMNVRTTGEAAQGGQTTQGDGVASRSKRSSSAAEKKKETSSNQNAAKEGGASTVDVNKTVDELLNSACSIATWVMLRSVLHHQLNRHSSTINMTSTHAPSHSSDASNLCVLTPPYALIEWAEVVSVLRRIFHNEHQDMAECILCAAFLRDDGRELMYCFIQEPKPNAVLQNAWSFTHSRKEAEQPTPPKPAPDTNHVQSPGLPPKPAGAQAPPPPKLSSPLNVMQKPNTAPATHDNHLSGVAFDDLNEEIETKYQRFIANSWSQYLEDVLLLSPLQFASQHPPKPSGEELNSRTFSQLATAYFFCSDEWPSEDRERRFKLLEDAKDQMKNETALGKEPSTNECGSAAAAATAPEADAHQISAESAGVAVLYEMETRIVNVSWTAALHRKVEHCVAARPPRLDVAKTYADKERASASIYNDFRAKQRGLTSVVTTLLAAGLSQEAVFFSRKHFNNERNEWASRQQTLFSAVRYLQSMVQLVQANAACQAHMTVIETAQIVIPQADLCDTMLNVLAPHPRGAFVLRFSDTRSKVLQSRIYLLKEAWRSLAFMKDVKDSRYFNEYLHYLRQIRLRYREGEIFEARMERGHQLMQRKQYAGAAEHFLDAVKLARKAEVINTHALPQSSLPDQEARDSGIPNESFHRNIHLKVAGSGSLTTAEEQVFKDSRDIKDLERMWRLAESERLLALAYVSQAENEVNVPQCRIELNNAVNYAYAAQATLQKWQLKGGTPKRMLTAVPCSLIVICKALLLLNQPKKAMLLLEPLIEQKPSSAAVRPPMWREILQPTPEPLTAEDIVLRMDVNSVTIHVYQLYAQCIVQFDEKKALRAVELVRSILIEGDRWIHAVGDQILQRYPQNGCSDISKVLQAASSPSLSYEDSEGGIASDSCDTIRVVLDSSSERLRALRALRNGSWDICRALRDIEIATGDAHCKLKHWEDALQTYETLLHILRDKTNSSDAFMHEDLKLSSYPAGPSSISPRDNESDSFVVGLAPAWRALLYEDDQMDTFSPVEDQALSISEGVTEEGFGNTTPGKDIVLVMAEEERVDHNAAANLIISKLADVHQAMGNLQTSISYHKFVLKYSKEIEDESLQYKSLLHLGRLYTATNTQPESQEAWERVSALAHEYDDQEVCRETMRNIITAQQNAGKYFEVVGSAEELDTLAQKAEGSGAAADRRFALEALAEAHLQLAQFDSCLSALDVRETVQEKSDEWNGKLYEMRAKARIGKGESAEAIKVLSSWVQKARQMKNQEEIGKGNYCLANAFASDHNEIQAQKCHIDAITAFSLLPVLNAAHKACILSSARWLVHYFYLCRERVSVDPVPEKVSPQEGKEPHVTKTVSSYGSGFENKSGNLSVLLSEDERKREGLPSLLKGNIDLDDGAVFANTAPQVLTAGDEDTGVSDSTGSTGSTKSRQHEGNDRASGSGRLSNSVAGTLGNVSMCNRPAATTSRDTTEVKPEETRKSDETRSSDCSGNVTEDPKAGKKKTRARATVSTMYRRGAIEILEWCTQLLVHRTRLLSLPILYSPAEAVDLVLLAHPNCTFVFFFAEYTTSSSGSYDIIIRPAGSMALISNSAQVTSLHPFREAMAHSNASSGTHDFIDRADSATQPSEFDTELEQQLGFLYEELWHPVESALKKSKFSVEDADCVFIVPDASLYNVPFGALKSGSSSSTSMIYASGKHNPSPPKPLGVIAPLVVTPSLTHLIQTGMTREASNFLKGKHIGKNIVLSDVNAPRVTGKLDSDEVISVAKRTLFGRKTVDSGTSIPADEPFKALVDWSIHSTCTRHGLVDMFRQKQSKSLILGCPVTTSGVKVSDGLVTCDDIIGTHSLSRKEPHYACRHLELVVTQNNQSHRTTEDNPGFSVKLCLHADCARVLRVENPTTTGLSSRHREVITQYISNLERVLRYGQEYPYALALQLTMRAAWKANLPLNAWGALTLIGVP